MGIPGLWEHLKDARSSATLLELSEDAWSNKPHRGYRVGIDVSLWLFHARKLSSVGDEDTVGVNAELRTLFYRVLGYLNLGLLPLFVFDGPSKPSWKRGNYVGGHWSGGHLQRQFVEVLDILGVKHRTAKGEAEAELARLTALGELDAVITDDVDTLLFGAPVIIRNNSIALSGNKTQPPIKDSKAIDKKRTMYARDVVLYRASDIQKYTGLNATDLVLIGLLSGGDYLPNGLKGCGPTIAVGLAKAGFSTSLMRACHSPNPAQALSDWREALASECAVNSSGFLPSRRPAIGQTIRSTPGFPNFEVVKTYLDPEVSLHGLPLRWDQEVDLPRLTTFCSRTFEWPVREIKAHFRTLLWKGLLFSELRRATLRADKKLPRELGTPGQLSGAQMIRALHDTKMADSTDGVRCYRVELAGDALKAQLDPLLPNPDPFEPVDDAPPSSSLPHPRASQTDSDDEITPPPASQRAKVGTKEPTGRSGLSQWIPAVCIEEEMSCSDLVMAYEEKVQEKERKVLEKEAKKANRGKAKAKSREPSSSPPKRTATASTKPFLPSFAPSTKSSISLPTFSSSKPALTIPKPSYKTLSARTISSAPPRPSSPESDLPEDLFAFKASPSRPNTSISNSQTVSRPSKQSILVLNSSSPVAPPRASRGPSPPPPLSPTKRRKDTARELSEFPGKKASYMDVNDEESEQDERASSSLLSSPKKARREGGVTMAPMMERKASKIINISDDDEEDEELLPPKVRLTVQARLKGKAVWKDADVLVLSD